jgi:hypothetical protein
LADCSKPALPLLRFDGLEFDLCALELRKAGPASL